ncbi:hypothetical protein LNP74_22045 [Klebsiella pneumoniae subsp. pneumoniae]|nr:hypothetical protein [Klebsiella pneumoniae subsp. pneumoniae]
MMVTGDRDAPAVKPLEIASEPEGKNYTITGDTIHFGKELGFSSPPELARRAHSLDGDLQR